MCADPWGKLTAFSFVLVVKFSNSFDSTPLAFLFLLNESSVLIHLKDSFFWGPISQSKLTVTQKLFSASGKAVFMRACRLFFLSLSLLL